MPPVGRPRVTTRQGARPPVNQLGIAEPLAYGVSVNPRTGGLAPWHMWMDTQEYVPELRWPNSVWVFDQMRTDSQAAALLTAVMYGITQLRFLIDPNGARASLVKEISEDFNLPIKGKDDEPLGRMKKRFSHHKFASQAMLASIYGHQYFEQLGTIENEKWRLRKMFQITPHSIQRINVADDGGLVSIAQWAAMVNGRNVVGTGVDYPEIPVDRLTGFVFAQEGHSWVGRSMLRDIYKDWLVKDRLMRVEAINHERAGGVPYANAPMGATVAEIEDLDAMMRQFRIGESAGGALPYGAELNIAKGSGSDIDKTIQRYNESMARKFLMMVANLAQGGQHVGSYALGDIFNDLWHIGQRAIAQWYVDVVNEHIIEDIVDWNYGPEEELVPKLTWERTREDSLGVDQLALLVQRGVIIVDDEVENAVRYKYQLPKRTEPRPPFEVVGPGVPRQPPEGGTVPSPSGAPSSGGGTTQASVEQSEPSWLKGLMDKMTAMVPFTHAAPAIQQAPAPSIHIEPHVHIPKPDPVTIEEGAVTVYPPDIHVHQPDVTVNPAEITFPEQPIIIQTAPVNVDVTNPEVDRSFSYKDGLAASMTITYKDGSERRYTAIRDAENKLLGMKEV